MPMPYMGQSFPRPTSGGGGGGFAFRLLGGIADTKRLMLGHELTKDLIYTRSAADAAGSLITGAASHENAVKLEGVKLGNAQTLETHKTGEINARVSHENESTTQAKKQQGRDAANSEASLYRRRQKSDLKTLQAVTAATRGAQWKDDGTTIDPKIVARAGDTELQRTGASRPSKDPTGD